MKFSIDKKFLVDYLAKQLNMFFPDLIEVSNCLVNIMPKAIERMKCCFSHIHKKYYFDNNQTIFNHLNSDHYAMFLYWIANEAYQHQYINLAEKAFLLNKALHGIDVFYSVKLPDIFLFVHPVGTILGNASYSNFFVVYQNVTIGTDVDGIYPTFGEEVVLYSKSSVIGNCNIGNNVSFAANSFIRNMDVHNNSIVFDLHPNAIIKKHYKNNKELFFGLVM